MDVEFRYFLSTKVFRYFSQDVDHIGMEEEEEEETEENLSKDFQQNIIFVEQNQQKVT